MANNDNAQGLAMPSQSEIASVYEQLGLTTASDRAFYTSMNPTPAAGVQFSVRIGSTSLPN